MLSSLFLTPTPLSYVSENSDSMSGDVGRLQHVLLPLFVLQHVQIKATIHMYLFVLQMCTTLCSTMYSAIVVA